LVPQCAPPPIHSPPLESGICGRGANPGLLPGPRARFRAKNRIRTPTVVAPHPFHVFAI
jgi:hypothetical protein